MRTRARYGIGLAALAGVLSGCSTVYYGTMEKMGVHKRDILVGRVKEAQASQKEAKTEFVSALEQFRSVVNFKGGDLEAQYNRLNGVLQRSEAKADEVHARVRSVEDVGDALFREWKKEMSQYTSDSLRRSSQQKYDQTLSQYKQMIAAMKNADSRLEPALKPLRDQVLFLKHNLNAQAIASLGDEVASVQTNVDALIRDIETSVAEADRFIAAMGGQ
jgi:hypothetical protein